GAERTRCPSTTFCRGSRRARGRRCSIECSPSARRPPLRARRFSQLTRTPSRRGGTSSRPSGSSFRIARIDALLAVLERKAPVHVLERRILRPRPVPPDLQTLRPRRRLAPAAAELARALVARRAVPRAEARARPGSLGEAVAAAARVRRAVAALVLAAIARQAPAAALLLRAAHAVFSRRAGRPDDDAERRDLVVESGLGEHEHVDVRPRRRVAR